MVCWEVVMVQVQVEVLSLWRPFPSLISRARPTPNFTAQPRASNSLWLLSLSQAELSCRGHTTKCSVQGDRTAANLHSIATTPLACSPAFPTSDQTFYNISHPVPAYNHITAHNNRRSSVYHTVCPLVRSIPQSLTSRAPTPGRAESRLRSDVACHPDI